MPAKQLDSCNLKSLNRQNIFQASLSPKAHPRTISIPLRGVCQLPTCAFHHLLHALGSAGSHWDSQYWDKLFCEFIELVHVHYIFTTSNCQTRVWSYHACTMSCASLLQSIRADCATRICSCEQHGCSPLDCRTFPKAARLLSSMHAAVRS